ncbi:MAG TPA: hypothetical protein VFV24_05810, partial [Candidatus Eisenbacteria bacterium]|nr:hypothetical protein [Candidatus Eisenbacteria bacterium]
MNLHDPKDALIGLSEPELERLLLSWGEKSFRGRQIAGWIYSHGALDFERMTNLPITLRDRLRENFEVATLTERGRRETPDRGTRKIAFGLRDGGVIESVFMTTPRRFTFCLSSQ